MKKLNIKPLVISALTAVAFGVVGVGTTFALFTDKTETSISVGTGIVNVKSQATLLSYRSSVDGTVESITGNTYSNPLVGNHFDLDGNVVSIEKMVPGDSLTLKLSAINKSNVKTKTRLVINHAKVGTKTDLYPALNLTFGLPNEGNPANLFKWTIHDPVPAASMEEGIELYDDLTVTITLPDNDNNQILFDSENHDNQYQDAACSITFSLEAVQGNAATNPIDEINAYLQAESIVEGQNKTMYEAIQDMAELSYGLDVLSDGTVNYVYSLDNDQFVAENTVTSNYNRYFKVYDEMPSTQTFSIYAADNFTTTAGAVTLSGVGFDAGESTGVMSISYTGLGQDNARSNIIRSNSLATSITVNAPYDTVQHYGDAASVNIEAIAGSSYHEFGNVAFTEIASGRIVLEEGSKTEQIHLNAQSSTSFAAITIANNGLENEDLPSKITRDQINVAGDKELVVTVQDLVNETVEPVYAYPYSYVEQAETIQVGTTEKTAVQNADVETALGLKVIDSNSHDGEKALAPDAKIEEKAAAIDGVIDDLHYVAQISTKFYTAFNDAFNEVKNNDTLKVINDCNAWSRYNASGKNLTIEVKKGVTLDCGAVANGKFEIGWNNAAGTLTFEGSGKLTFDPNGDWGLVTKNGSNDNAKVAVKDLTIEASAEHGKLMSSNRLSITVESGNFKNIDFVAGQIKEGYEAKLNDVTGYYEIVEKEPEPAEQPIFALFPTNEPSNVTYYYASDVDKLTYYEDCVPGGHTLQLLAEEYEFTTTLDRTGALICFFGNDIIFDLCKHELTITAPNLECLFTFGTTSMTGLVFQNGTIHNGSGRGQLLLQNQDNLSDGAFVSNNVTYDSTITLP